MIFWYVVVLFIVSIIVYSCYGLYQDYKSYKWISSLYLNEEHRKLFPMPDTYERRRIRRYFSTCYRYRDEWGRDITRSYRTLINENHILFEKLVLIPEREEKERLQNLQARRMEILYEQRTARREIEEA